MTDGSPAPSSTAAQSDDPFADPDWPLPIALAWIMTRDPDVVRRLWGRLGLHSLMVETYHADPAFPPEGEEDRESPRQLKTFGLTVNDAWAALSRACRGKNAKVTLRGTPIGVLPATREEIDAGQVSGLEWSTGGPLQRFPIVLRRGTTRVNVKDDPETSDVTTLIYQAGAEGYENVLLDRGEILTAFPARPEDGAPASADGADELHVIQVARPKKTAFALERVIDAYRELEHQGEHLSNLSPSEVRAKIGGLYKRKQRPEGELPSISSVKRALKVLRPGEQESK